MPEILLAIRMAMQQAADLVNQRFAPASPASGLPSVRRRAELLRPDGARPKRTPAQAAFDEAFTTGRPAARQAARPPSSGRTRQIPRRCSESATRALVASFGQVQ